jgi:hypothetical protein
MSVSVPMTSFFNDVKICVTSYFMYGVSHEGKYCTKFLNHYSFLKHGRQNITLHWINGIIRNNKCILTKLNAVFIFKTAAWTTNIITVISVTNTWSIQQTPMFHGCTITNKQNFEPWKLSTSWGHTYIYIYIYDCWRSFYSSYNLMSNAYSHACL